MKKLLRIIRPWLCLLLMLFSVSGAWGEVTPLSLPKTWAASDGKSAYTEALGCTLSGLGSDYSSAPKLKFDSQGDYMIIQVADAPANISFDIKGNSTSGTYSFKVQESADGTTYSDALNLTSVSSSVANKNTDLKSSTRYIKLLYAIKASGNIGVGGICITKATSTQTLTSLVISGTPTKTTYESGDAFDPAGLTVTGTYSDNSTATITEGISWTYDYGTDNTALVAGTTSVGVTATVGTVSSSKTTISGLTVNALQNAAPSITSQPTSVTVDQDAIATLTIAASGYPAPTYQWYSCTDNQKTGAAAIDNATNATYSPSTATAGEYYFYCAATNEEGTVASDVAKVTVNKSKFTVTFDAGTGTCTTTSLTQASKGASITLPASSTVIPATTEDGCKFIGWATSKTETATTTKPTLLSGTAYTPTKDETLYAVYQYTVGGNGGYILSQTSGANTYYVGAKSGTYLTATTDKSKAVEWFWGDGLLYYKDGSNNQYVYHSKSTGQEYFDFSTTVPTNLWTITESTSTTVRFNSKAQSSRCIQFYNNAFKARTTTTALNKEVCGTIYYSSVPTAPTWSNVTLNTNCGTINAGNVTTYREGVGATLPTDVTKTGYTFAGWYNNSSLTGDAVKSISTSATGAQTFWAKWTAHTYIVKFNANGGTGEMADQSFTYDEAAKALTANAFTKTGYSFAGWATTADGEKTYDNEAKVQNLTSTDKATINLYALWSVNNYNVVFNKNNESATGEMANQSITFGQSANLTANAYAATGQVFMGWATTADGEVVYTDGASYTMNTEGTTLYAKWVDDVRVSGVSLSETSKTVTYGAEDFTLVATIAPENAVDKTVTWTSSNPDVATVSNGTVHIVGAGTATITVKSNADETRTATCVLTVNKADVVITPTTPDNTWNVTLKIGATLTPAFETTPADAQITLAITEGNDYITLSEGVITGVAAGSAKVTATFAGNNNYNELVKTFNITVPEKLTLTYSVNGNTSIKAAGKYYEGDEIDLTAPTSGIPEGYVFKGWSDATVATQQTAPTYVGTTMPAESTTYYAVFAKASVVESTWSETALANLASGDVFVFSDGSYAMTNNNGTTSAPSAVSITVSNSQITSEITDAMMWNIGGNATDGYTFYPNGSTTTWLYCNTTASSSSNNNLRVGTGDRKLWITSSDKLKTNDSYTARYISNYSNSDFRGYTSSSSAFVPKFYKLTGGTSYSDFSTSVVVKTLSSIEFGGSLTKTVYTEEETFDPAGITVLASYEGQAEKEDITDDVTLTYSTDPLTVGTTSINVSASYKGFDVNKDYDITVNAIPTYIVTIVAPENGTLTVKKGETTVNSGDAFRAGTVLNITAIAAEGYKFRNIQVVDGSTHTFTASNEKEWALGAVNTTIKANFDALQQYQVTWMANGTQLKQETVSENAGSAAPEVTCPTGYTLAGWATTAINEETTTVPTFATLTDGKYMPEAATTLYAVYTRSEGGQTVYTINKDVAGFPTTYDAAGDLVVNGFTFNLDDVANFGSNMQFKKSTGMIVNESELPMAINSVVVTYSSATSYKNLALYIGDEAQTTENVITPSVNENVYTFDCSSSSHKFFSLTVNSNNACNVDEVVITCGNSVGTTYYCTTVKVKVTPALSFAPAEYWVSEGATIVSPAVICDQSDATITYAVTEGDAAEVTTDGTVGVIEGETGDVTITATVTEDADFNTASASYILHVVAPQTVKVSSAGWATFAPSYNVELPTGVYENGDADGKPAIRMYYVAENSENKIGFVDAKDKVTSGNAIAAGTGVLVKAKEGTYNFPVNTTATTKDLDGTLLVGVTSDKSDKPENAYIFSNGSKGIGFYPWLSGTLKANKCYLQLSKQAGATTFIGLPEDDEATAITNVNASDNANDKVYDLTGRRVNGNARGMLIVNGKKVVRK